MRGIRAFHMEKMSGRTGQVAQRSVLSLPDLVAELEAEEQDCFRRLFTVDTTVGELVLPLHMVSWVERYFGSERWPGRRW